MSRAALSIIAALALALACATLWGAFQAKRADGWRVAYQAAVAASQANIAATKALRAQERAEYERKADVADAKHAAALDRARALTDVYVRSNRVQPSGSSPAAAIGEAGDAGQPADLSRSAVMVGIDDVRRAAEWQAYGIACHDWALAITAP